MLFCIFLFFFRLVTPTSKILFQLFSHSTFRRDNILGEARLDLHKQLVREQGKFENANVVMELKGELKPTATAVQSSSGGRVKIGELFTVLDGMRIDTKLLLNNGNRNLR